MLIGAIIDNCQKFIIITGSVKVKAESVRLKAVLISKIFGINFNFFSKKG
ncbi:MAG: hypothetical protein LBD88_00460 [Candidatus Peribacteria bacterium]|nr:hypothetical protein [Candidatus Peribacteria bacterium]